MPIRRLKLKKYTFYSAMILKLKSKRFQDEEGEENMSKDFCKEEDICHYPFPAKKKLFSVHIRPHVGNLSDYPYCITPQQTVF